MCFYSEKRISQQVHTCFKMNDDEGYKIFYKESFVLLFAVHKQRKTYKMRISLWRFTGKTISLVHMILLEVGSENEP